MRRRHTGTEKRFGMLVLGLCLCVACGDRTRGPLVAQTTGEFAIDGLTAPVRIVRDRWGVPHIYAQSQDDLFIAQGFVQAQDRLFQMDLWRRSVQGRLAEVFGSNFAGRDAMTRRVQYRGDLEAEWASYGADARAIATAFVTGVNAGVAAARERPPEEFRLAGWAPEFWSADDLINRTDAFLASGDALAEVEREGLSYVIGDAIRRVGTAPFFIGLEEPVQGDAGGPMPPMIARDVRAARQRATSVGHASAPRGGPLMVTESTGELSAPSPRYFVHLNAPGWNVIGAVRPWLPGVAIGHNERIAWGSIPYAADTQDLRELPLNGPDVSGVNDALGILGRSEPMEYDSQVTPQGPVVATDKERNVAFVLRWSGSEPGAAAELGALAINRAHDWTAFREALTRWKMPLRRFVYADSVGNVGLQAAGLVPVRQGREWRGWMSLDDLPHTSNPPDGVVRVAQEREQATAGDEAEFAHVLGINAAARRRFTVGPVARPSGDEAVRGVFDPSAWDRSTALNAPGQSESPASVHSRDQAALWSRGEMFPLAFSDAEVEKYTESTLTLMPVRR